MKRKNPDFKKVVMSISAIGILYFAVVNVIGDTVGIFDEAPLYDPAQDPGLAEHAPAAMQDHVRNAELVTAVLFPDGTRRRPVPPQAAFPDPAPFGNFDFMDAGNAEYIVSTNHGSNLLASLNPRSVDPQNFTPFASNPNRSGGNRGITGLPGGGQPRPAIGGQPVPDAKAAGGKSLPAQQTDLNEDFIPVQIAASHIPDNSFDGNGDDHIDGDDAPPGVSQSNLQARTPSPVAEPASLLLMLLAMGGLRHGSRHYRKRPGL